MMIPNRASDAGPDTRPTSIEIDVDVDENDFSYRRRERTRIAPLQVIGVRPIRLSAPEFSDCDEAFVPPLTGTYIDMTADRLSACGLDHEEPAILGWTVQGWCDTWLTTRGRHGEYSRIDTVRIVR